MTCTVDGCYAMTFRRNLCRHHFYAWNDQLQTTAPRKRKETLRATPVPPSTWTYYCTCPAPIIMPTGLVPSAVQCQRCGKPPLDSLSPRKELT